MSDETKTKAKPLPTDRSVLAEMWAAAVAEVDHLEGLLLAARQHEREVWVALESSRRKTVHDE